MNTQNILQYYGSKFDLKLDISEFCDYELATHDLDYDSCGDVEFTSTSEFYLTTEDGELFLTENNYFLYFD